MTPIPWLDVAIIAALVMLNGLFAMSELAIVSARRARLQAMAENHKAGARTALRLAADPGRFLSTVQIGITLIGIVAGAYSGASLGGPVGERLAAAGVDPGLADEIGFTIVIALTTYASLVIGELVPKQIALRNAEVIAVVMAPPMDLLARAAAPLVWLLDRTSALIFRLMGLKRKREATLTAEELHMIFAEATHSGVIEEHERQMIAGVVRMADRPIREVMTPRPEIDWIEVDASLDEIVSTMDESPHSRLLVASGSVDDILGAVRVRDIMATQLSGRPVDLRAIMYGLEKIPDQVDAMDALELLRGADVPILLVTDEYGHLEGIVTPSDLLSAIAGEFKSDQDLGDAPHVIERSDGSLLVSGSMPVDQLADRLDLELPEDRDYATVAGHVLELLRRLPQEGETVEDQGWLFEVVDMDGRRIDKLIVREVAAS